MTYPTVTELKVRHTQLLLNSKRDKLARYTASVDLCNSSIARGSPPSSDGMGKTSDLQLTSSAPTTLNISSHVLHSTLMHHFWSVEETRQKLWCSANLIFSEIIRLVNMACGKSFTISFSLKCKESIFTVKQFNNVIWRGPLITRSYTFI